MHGTLNKSGYVRTNMSRVYGTNAPYSTVTNSYFNPTRHETLYNSDGSKKFTDMCPTVSALCINLIKPFEK
jgi:hypothetical protein